MKKLISVILILALALTLFACGGKEGGKKDGLYISFGRQNIMPDMSIPTPMGGYGATDTRLSTEYMDYLMATCLAITEGDETVLIYTQDLIQCYPDFFNGGRKAVSEATGIPENRIFFAATHTHSAPDTTKALGTNEAIDAYYEIWREGVVNAAKDAIADQKKVTSMGAAHVETEKLAYVRHYRLIDGSYAGDNFGNWQAGPIEDYADEADEQMVLLQIDREGQDKPIVLMNFQVHACITGGATLTTLSADVIGSVRTYLEKTQDMHFAYFTGAAGNQNLTTKIAADVNNLDYKSYGETLGNYALEAMKSLEKVEGTDLKINQQVYTGDINHAMEDKYDKAKEVYDLYNQTGDRDAANKKAVEYGFASVYHCNAVVRRKEMPLTMDMEINAISIGDFALITAPYEMFSTEGIKIKSESPYKYTFILTNAGENRGYIPNQKMYQEGCYESHTANYAPGTAEKVADRFLQMLKELKG